MYAFDDLDLSVKVPATDHKQQVDILCCRTCGSATGGCISVFFTNV